jgi:hypothetical protein
MPEVLDSLAPQKAALMILRLARSRRAVPIRSADLGSLMFGQLAPEHQDLLGTGSRIHNRIELRDLPHYRFWRDCEDLGLGGGSYDKFLACTESDPSCRAEAIAEYVRLRDDIRRRGVKEPVRIVVAPDGDRVVLDGCKRAAIAYALGQDVPFTEVGLDEVLRSIVANPHEKYGTGPVGRPYQSIFFKEKELVPGRRTDVLERFRKLRIEDVRGRHVLDRMALWCRQRDRDGVQPADRSGRPSPVRDPGRTRQVARAGSWPAYPGLNPVRHCVVLLPVPPRGRQGGIGRQHRSGDRSNVVL